MLYPKGREKCTASGQRAELQAATIGNTQPATIYLIHKQASKERAGHSYIEIKSKLETLGHDKGYQMVNLNHIEQIKRRSIARAEGLIAIGKYNDKEIAKLKSLSNCIVFLDFDNPEYDTVNLESEFCELTKS